MKFHLRILFLVITALIFKVIFDKPYLPAELNTIQDALNAKFLIKKGKKLAIHMKKVIKVKNPKAALNHLVLLGGDINELSTNGLNPLAFSATKGDKEMIKYLLSKGAHANLALTLLILQGHAKAASRLVKCGANCNYTDEAGYTPLLYAILILNKEFFNTLKQVGLIGNTSISSIAMIRLIKLLLMNGANPNVKFNGIDALNYARATFEREVVRLMIEHDANPNIKLPDETGITPLMQFVQIDDYEMVKLLLEKGADVNFQDNEGKTALFYAKDKAIAQLLVNHCSNINFKGFQGYTALNWAAHQNNIELVELLFAQGADPAIKNDEAKSALDHVKL